MLLVPPALALVAERAGYRPFGFDLEAGAAVLTAGMWLVAWLIWRQVRPRARDHAVAFGACAVLAWRWLRVEPL
jgi:hypothetical protein